MPQNDGAVPNIKHATFPSSILPNHNFHHCRCLKLLWSPPYHSPGARRHSGHISASSQRRSIALRIYSSWMQRRTDPDGTALSVNWHRRTRPGGRSSWKERRRPTEERSQQRNASPARIVIQTSEKGGQDSNEIFIPWMKLCHEQQ